MKSSESDVVSVSRWSVIGTKVYRDDILFAKCANWPNAIAIRDALSCHDDLLEACKLVDRAFCGDGVQMSTAVDACLMAIAKATTTPQKEGAK